MAVSKLAEWKKQKPVTLLKDPLSPALKDLDAALGKLDQHQERSDLAAITGAAKSAKLAMNKTIELCNSKLHKETIAYLGRKTKEMDSLVDIVTKWQKDLNAFLADFHKKRDAVVAELNKVVAKPSGPAATACQKSIDTFLGWCDKEAVNLSSDEVLFGQKYAATASSNMGELVKILAKNPVDEARKKKCLDEAASIAKKIATPGGHTEKVKAKVIQEIVRV